MTLTEKYSLKKPDNDDFYDIAVQNSNMDIIENIMSNFENEKQPKTTAKNSFIKADGNGILIPTNINKATVGLDRVDNTRDMDKPISNNMRNEINNLQNNINNANNSLNSFKNQIHFEDRTFRACFMSEEGGEWPTHYQTDGRMTRIGNMVFSSFKIKFRPPGMYNMPILVGGFPYRPRFGGGAIVFQSGNMNNAGYPRQFSLSIGGKGHSFYIRFSNGEVYDTIREFNFNRKEVYMEGYVIYFI